MFSQYKQKKKRAVNPDIPRPNLMSHEKRLKEVNDEMGGYKDTIAKQQDEISRLRVKVNRLENSVQTILSYLKR